MCFLKRTLFVSEAGDAVDVGLSGGKSGRTVITYNSVGDISQTIAKLLQPSECVCYHEMHCVLGLKIDVTTSSDHPQMKNQSLVVRRFCEVK